MRLWVVCYFSFYKCQKFLPIFELFRFAFRVLHFLKKFPHISVYYFLKLLGVAELAEYLLVLYRYIIFKCTLSVVLWKTVFIVRCVFRLPHIELNISIAVYEHADSVTLRLQCLHAPDSEDIYCHDAIKMTNGGKWLWPCRAIVFNKKDSVAVCFLCEITAFAAPASKGLHISDAFLFWVFMFSNVWAFSVRCKRDGTPAAMPVSFLRLLFVCSYSFEEARCFQHNGNWAVF